MINYWYTLSRISYRERFMYVTLNVFVFYFGKIENNLEVCSAK